jgi:hypothetical protein
MLRYTYIASYSLYVEALHLTGLRVEVHILSHIGFNVVLPNYPQGQLYLNLSGLHCPVMNCDAVALSLRVCS